MFAIPLFAIIGKEIGAGWAYWVFFGVFCLVEVICRIDIEFERGDE